MEKSKELLSIDELIAKTDALMVDLGYTPSNPFIAHEEAARTDCELSIC
jgi:hypothetical protein